MQQHQPSSLPEVDEVEIVDVSAIDPDRVTDYVVEAEHSPCTRLSRPDSDEVVRLWRELPHAEQMRCHLPPFVVRFFAKTSRIAQFSLCWSCNNAFGFEHIDAASFSFDGSSGAARELLKVLRKSTPSKVHRE